MLVFVLGGNDMAIEAGWYNDPEYPSQLRWWSGSEWTAHRTPAPAATLPAYPPPEPMPTAMPTPMQTPMPTPVPIVERFVPPRADPAPKPRRSRGWLWIVGGVAVAALIVGTTFATGHLTFGTATLATTSTPAPAADSGSGAAPTTPQLSDLSAFGVPAAPAGMASETGGTVTNNLQSSAGQELQNDAQLSKVPLSIPACTALTYDTPITSADVGSTDPIDIFPDYRSVDGTSSLAVHGAVRQYPSAAAAEKSFAAMSAINLKCSNGYSNPEGQIKMEGVTADWPGTTTVAWIQQLPTGNIAPVEVETFNMLRGTLIVRGICAYSAKTSTLAGQCLNWMSTLHDSVVRAAS